MTKLDFRYSEYITRVSNFTIAFKKTLQSSNYHERFFVCSTFVSVKIHQSACIYKNDVSTSLITIGTA